MFTLNGNLASLKKRPMPTDFKYDAQESYWSNMSQGKQEDRDD